jgi:hypothetical protein
MWKLWFKIMYSILVTCACSFLPTVYMTLGISEQMFMFFLNFIILIGTSKTESVVPVFHTAV